MPPGDASVTHWIYTGKQLNGIRRVSIHPQTAVVAQSNVHRIDIEVPQVCPASSQSHRR